MTTGTIPGLPAGMAGPPATVGPTPADSASNSQFDAWELAAMAIGAAASKSTPLTIDAVEYYNRIVGFPPAADSTASPPVPPYVSPWGVSFVRSARPGPPRNGMAGSEQLVDYSHFSYNRSQTFKGSVTWLDVANMKWVVSKITDVVPFTNLSSYDKIGTHTLTGSRRSRNSPMTCERCATSSRTTPTSPASPWTCRVWTRLRCRRGRSRNQRSTSARCRRRVFQTFPFQMTASLLNPWGGSLIGNARLRITIDAPADLPR